MDTRSNFHTSLGALESELQQMGSHVEQAIERAVVALTTSNEAIAREVVERDDEIDSAMLRIEEQCLNLIALQQPMGSDLRKIGTALKTAVDLERIADHAVDIAKAAIRLSGEKLIKPLVDIPQMADIAKDMLRESLLAYKERNIHRAAALAEKDDKIDKLYASVVHDTLSLMSDDYRTNRQLVQLIQVAHFLERVGDHTTNIGEGVIFMTTGKRKDLNV